MNNDMPETLHVFHLNVVVLVCIKNMGIQISRTESLVSLNASKCTFFFLCKSINLIKKQLLSVIAREHRRLFHDDVELKLNIAIDNVYWLKRPLSTSAHRDRLDLTARQHFQQLWLRHRYYISKRIKVK